MLSKSFISKTSTINTLFKITTPTTASFGQKKYSTNNQFPLTTSYCHGTSNKPLIHETIGSSFLKTVEKYPDKEAVVFCESDTRKTFSQFWTEVENFAAGLLKLGFKKGDLIGIWGPSSLEWAITQFATSLIGAILVNVNPAYQVNEVAYVLEKVGCKGIVASGKFKTQDYYGMLKKVCPELGECGPGQLKSKRFPNFTHVIMMGKGDYPGAFSFDDVASMSSPAIVGQVHNTMSSLCFDDLINVQFTSGTTGFPKGATLTHHNVVNNAYIVGNTTGYPDSDHRICCQVPLYHCFGMVAGLLCMSVHGVANVFPTAGYDPQATMNSLQNERVTMLYGTPTMFVDACALAESKNFQLPHLQKGVIAGSPVPPDLVKKAEKTLGIFMHIGYGSTETSPVVCMTDETNNYDDRISSNGLSCPHTENMVADSEGRPLPLGEPGELLSRGYCVMAKYWADPEKTKSAIDEKHWYHTGDIATMDANGFIRITGRTKDMIIRGGENIYPAEIENYLHSHPAIEDAQVFGVPDKRFGEELAVWVKVKQGEDLSEEEIKKYCKGNIAHYKIPRYYKFVDEFPLTVTRKVKKYQMREEYAKEMGLI